MYDKSQLMRGTLEGCILKFLSEETTYGYELVEKLEQYGFEDIKEGTCLLYTSRYVFNPVLHYIPPQSDGKEKCEQNDLFYSNNFLAAL